MRSAYLVIGAGIAGASASYHLARSGSVTVLEAESVPGYHSTSRSAALFSEYYGNAAVRALTAASRDFFTTPPPGFTEHPLLTPRGVVALCPDGAEERFARAFADGLTAPEPVREIGLDDVQRYCPIVRRGWYSRAMHKPAADDIDVDRLHQGFLRGVRSGGGTVVTAGRVRAIEYRAGLWRVSTDAGEFVAPVVVNAAGAWADEVAGLAGVCPIGLTALRRTAFVVDAPVDMAVAGWPMVADVTETFYFKPESGGLLVSPVDATPVPPGDARPDDLDVAIGAARIEEVTTLTIRRIRHSWAGLRSTVSDECPVIGAAPDAPGFFWMAAFGGFGVQIAPAAGQFIAAEIAAAVHPRIDGALRGAVVPQRIHRLG